MKYVVLDIEAVGIDVSEGRISNDWQTIFVDAGCAGHVPLERYTVDGHDVMVVYGCDTEQMDLPAGAVVFQTDDEATWQAWLEANVVQVTE